MVLEACIENLEELDFAEKKGFDRVELCTALSQGGLSPSYSFIKKACKSKVVEVHVMIRPRGGYFRYSNSELKLMKKEISIAKKLGAKGVVLGCLNENDELAFENQTLIHHARSIGLEVTFHRAFDLIKNKFEALQLLVSWGVKRVLTSGGGRTAMEGLDVIQDLQKRFGDQIEIMAGSGIHGNNIQFFKAALIPAVHFSIGKVDVKLPLGFGYNRSLDREKVEAILDQIN